MHVCLVNTPGMITASSKLKTVFCMYQLECGPMLNLMAALPNIGGALCLAPQSLPDANYSNAVQ